MCVVMAQSCAFFGPHGLGMLLPQHPATYGNHGYTEVYLMYVRWTEVYYWYLWYCRQSHRVALSTAPPKSIKNVDPIDYRSAESRPGALHKQDDWPRITRLQKRCAHHGLNYNGRPSSICVYTILQCYFCTLLRWYAKGAVTLRRAVPTKR